MQTAIIRHRKLVLVSVVIALVIGAVSLAVLRTSPRAWFVYGHNTIRELQDVPPGPVRLEGVVTYIDQSGKRFWIQDQTGAIAIRQNSASLVLHAGQVVHVDARKTKLYDSSLGLVSIGLKDEVVTPTKKDRALPEAIQVSLAIAPGVEEDGVRVEIHGAVHATAQDEFGRLRITIGDSLKEVTVIAPRTSADSSNWKDAAITVTGVMETKIDDAGALVAGQIWVREPVDIHVDIRNIPNARL